MCAVGVPNPKAARGRRQRGASRRARALRDGPPWRASSASSARRRGRARGSCAARPWRKSARACAGPLDPGRGGGGAGAPRGAAVRRAPPKMRRAAATRTRRGSARAVAMRDACVERVAPSNAARAQPARGRLFSRARVANGPTSRSARRGCAAPCIDGETRPLRGDGAESGFRLRDSSRRCAAARRHDAKFSGRSTASRGDVDWKEIGSVTAARPKLGQAREAQGGPRGARRRERPEVSRGDGGAGHAASAAGGPADRLQVRTARDLRGGGGDGRQARRSSRRVARWRPSWSSGRRRLRRRRRRAAGGDAARALDRGGRRRAGAPSVRAARRRSARVRAALAPRRAPPRAPRARGEIDSKVGGPDRGAALGRATPSARPRRSPTEIDGRAPPADAPPAAAPPPPGVAH